MRIDWHGRRFLLVEDNEDHQWLTLAMLRDTGVEIVTTASGEAAIETIEKSLDAEQAFDLVLMDIRLPTLNGYETTARLRELGYGGPIVALTARVMETEIQKCHEAGCDACVRKPFDRETLRGTIAEWLVEVASGKKRRGPTDEDIREPASSSLQVR